MAGMGGSFLRAANDVLCCGDDPPESILVHCRTAAIPHRYVACPPTQRHSDGHKQLLIQSAVDSLTYQTRSPPPPPSTQMVRILGNFKDSLCTVPIKVRTDRVCSAIRSLVFPGPGIPLSKHHNVRPQHPQLDPFTARHVPINNPHMRGPICT